VHPETRVVKLAQWASERQRPRSTLEVIAT
jgi:hypothetical protein